MSKRTGIIDPWRKVEPLRPEKAAARVGKKDIDDIDHDADLAVPGRYVIRGNAASFEVVSTRIDTPKDALDVLAECIAELWRNKYVGVALQNADIGVRTKDHTYNAPDGDTPASTLKSDHSTVWFCNEPLDKGMVKLARIMRSSAALPIVKKHGITPMLKA